MNLSRGWERDSLLGMVHFYGGVQLMVDIALSELKDIILVLQSQLIVGLEGAVQSQRRKSTTFLRPGREFQGHSSSGDLSRLVEVSHKGRIQP